LLGPGPRLMKKRIYRAAVSQRLRNTDLHDTSRTPSLRTSHSSCKFNPHFFLLPQYFLPPNSHLCFSYSSSPSTRSYSHFQCQTAATGPGHLCHYQCSTTAVSGLRLPAGASVFATRRSIQTGSDSQPASRGTKADHHLVPRLIMRGALPPVRYVTMTMYFIKVNVNCTFTLTSFPDF